MVRTVKTKERIVPAKTKKVTRIICDLCSKTVVIGAYGGGGGQCYICNRDICDDHTVREYDGDYATKFCTICYSSYKPAIEQLKERHWKEEEALKRKIKRQSLATPSEEQ